MDTREAIDIDLGYVYRSVQRSWLLAAGVFVGCVGLALAASTQLTPDYQANAKLLFTKVDRTSALASFNNADTGQLQSLLIDQTPLTTEIEIIVSRPLLQETIEQLGLKDDDGEPLAPEALIQGMELTIVGGTDIVEIVYTHPDAEVATAVVNTLVDVYREYSIQTNRTEASEAKDFLLAQLPQTEESVRRADQALEDFLETNDIGILAEEAVSLVASRENIGNQISVIESNLESAAARSNLLQNTLQLTPQEAFSIGNLRQTPGVQEALLALQVVERDLASQAARYNANSPVVRQLTAERDSLQALLEQEIASSVGGNVAVPPTLLQGNADGAVVQTLIQDFLNTEVEYEGLQQQLAVLREYEAAYQNRIRSIPSLTSVQRELERRVTVAEVTYQNLLTRLQELQVQENEATYNTRIIQPAVEPTEPVSGDKVKILALGVMGGAFMAVAIMVLSEVIRFRRVRSFVPSASSISTTAIETDVPSSSIGSR